MRFGAFVFIVLAVACLGFAAGFSVAPYIYASEKNASVDYATFAYGNNSTAKIVKIGGEEALLVIDEKMITDKSVVSAALSDYYQKNLYPTAADMADLQGFADKFNKSRNAQTRYGPAEQICYTQATFLSFKPCSDMTSCTATASLVCTISGADGCMIDVLATHILAYSKGVTKLNDAYAKFKTGYSSFGPSSVTNSLDTMNDAFDMMKAASDDVSKSKLIFPEDYVCRDCLGICPQPRFDYASITAGKAKITALREKTKPFSSLNKIVDKIALSTQDRIAYKDGEEKALIYQPKYNAAKDKYGGLKAQAVLAKALVADSNFISAADTYLSKGDELEQKVEKRQFDGFETLLSGYESAGGSLLLLINNSTAAYQTMLDAQDSAGDQLLQSMWRVNRLSKQSLDSYNALADRKNKLDARFTPPMTSAQYNTLSTDYTKLTSDAKQYVAVSASFADSVFSVGNTFGRTSVDGAMTLASNMMPISFKTRQSVAKYIPPIVLGVIDLSILALMLLVFAGLFYHFHKFFKSKLAISGGVLTMIGFVFVLLIGSAGFYGIVLSTEKYTTFTDFYGTIQKSDKAAVVVYETGVSSDGLKGMRSCADQIESQLAAIGKRTQKYYIDGNTCRSLISNMAANSTKLTYNETTGLNAEKCLDSIPDIPIFDLKYMAENQPPVFTTVITKQALFKGNDDYYSKKPMCDAANVLN